MSSGVDMPASGPRLLTFGKEPANAAMIQDRLRTVGYRATTFALTMDAEGDARLAAELEADTYDGVVIGGFINGQHPDMPPTEERTLWFERVLNLIHEKAPSAKIILNRQPSEALQSVERVLGPLA
jgi:hypothetical protein